MEPGKAFSVNGLEIDSNLFSVTAKLYWVSPQAGSQQGAPAKRWGDSKRSTGKLLPRIVVDGISSEKYCHLWKDCRERKKNIGNQQKPENRKKFCGFARDAIQIQRRSFSHRFREGLSNVDRKKLNFFPGSTQTHSKSQCGGWRKIYESIKLTFFCISFTTKLDLFYLAIYSFSFRSSPKDATPTSRFDLVY